MAGASPIAAGRPRAPAGRDLRRRLAGRADEMLALLERFVTIESGSLDREGVNRAGDALAAELASLGFGDERIPTDDLGDHRVFRRRGGGTGRLLVLVHLDTVWPAGTLASFPFAVADGRASGPGVADMKGGWVVLLEALRALQAAGNDPLAEVVVFATADEELGSPRGRPWIEREAARADWALVMEPARENGALVVARGMVGALGLEVHGRTAHAAFGDRGASAVEELAHKVLALRALSDPAAGVLVNVGVVRGGTARQVVPDLATASVDLRAPSAADADRLLAGVERVARERRVPGTSCTLSGGITRPAFERGAGTDALLGLAAEVGHEIGIAVEGAATRAGSDGNFTAALGVPTLDGLGPIGRNVCSRDEYVVVDSVPERAALLAGLIARLPELPRRGAGGGSSGGRRPAGTGSAG